MRSTLTICDSANILLQSDGPIYTWNGYKEDNNTRSLLKYCDLHSDRLRQKYLEWIHELGESKIDGKRIIDHLAFRDGFSYWWMTLLVEKSPYKSPISDAIRLLALEEIIIWHKPKCLCLVSSNKTLYKTLRDLCRNCGIEYKWKQITNTSVRRLSVKRVYQMLPRSMQSPISLVRYLSANWSFKKISKRPWFDGSRALFFCSYFDDVEFKTSEDRFFHSHYWGGLIRVLEKLGYLNNWLQLFTPSKTSPTSVVAVKLINSINKKNAGKDYHLCLASYLSWSLVIRVVGRWLYHIFISCRFKNIKNFFRPKNCSISLWHLMKDDWYQSLRGPHAINNLLLLELFNVAMNDLPYQKKGLYLCENQGWERAFVHCWRKYRHGQLIAVVHSTVRFWDLRYFTDKHTSRSPYPLPEADHFVLNGKVAIETYLAATSSKSRITACEALRYDHLNVVQNTKHHPSLKRTREDEINLLVLGDILPSCTDKMLRLLEAAMKYMPSNINISIKPHPNYLVSPLNYPSLKLSLVLWPIGEILKGFDVAYSSNMTSAAVDAYCSGIPVIVMLDSTTLNFCPLRGQPGVNFVSTDLELSNALRARKNRKFELDAHNFFFLDTELSRWHQLLIN